MSSWFSAGCSHCGNPVVRLLTAFSQGRCLLCVLKWPHQSRDATVAADPMKWSATSQRSRGFDPHGVRGYADEYYWCRRCGAPAVFTAEQQREAFEVRKKPIYQRRVHCERCWQAGKKRR